MTRMSWVCVILAICLSGCASRHQHLRSNAVTPLPRCNDRFSLTDDEAVLNEKTQRILVEALVHTVVQSAVNVAIEKQDLEMSEHERALAHSSSALATELFLQKIRR